MLGVAMVPWEHRYENHSSHHEEKGTPASQTTTKGKRNENNGCLIRDLSQRTGAARFSREN